MISFVRTDDAARESRKGHREDTSGGERLDKAGTTASFLCAIHCAIMPFIVTILPLLGLGFLSSEPVEWALLACSATLGTLSLCIGYRQHRRRRAFGVLGTALALLVLGRFCDERNLGVWSTLFMVAGGFTMMTVHILNRKLCHSCPVCKEPRLDGEQRIEDEKSHCAGGCCLP